WLPPSLVPAHAACPRFPYTTLFRSVRRRPVVLGARAAVGLGVHPRAAAVHVHPVHLRAVDGGPAGGAGAPRAAGVHRGARAAHRDRKSTRLNSSHVSISYAVFCLKN